MKANSHKGVSSLAVYNKYLYDLIGNEYERKNLYLEEIAILEEEIKDANKESKSELKSKLKSLYKNKHKNEYNIELKQFKDKEKLFFSKLKNEKKSFQNSLDKNISRKMKKLKTMLFEVEKKYDFYNDYMELTYDAKFEFKKAKFSMRQIPEIIDFLNENEIALKTALNAKGNIDLELDKKAKLEISEFKKMQKDEFKEEKKRLKEMRRQNIISEKAKKNSILELKKKNKDLVKLKSYDSMTKSNRELIKNKRFEINNGTKQKLTILRSDIADLRRKVPIETSQSKPIFGWLTFLIPGLGQVLNRQYIKGIAFFFISLFVYLIAIPYALGYGNYQGQGISGLISLAEGGKRLDKSLIFMIEGILAIFLLVLAVGLLYFSFKDVLSVEKNRIKGIRPNSWFETKTSIQQNGFPYMVSSPALFLIMFTVLIPIATTIMLSFTGMDPKHQSKFSWVGIQNYKLIALGQGLAGEIFWYILFWTVLWTLLSTTLAILIGFTLSLLANNERVIGKTFFRTVYILPWAVPAFITIMFFSIMFSPDGALTEILNYIMGRRIEVKLDPNLTRIVLILLQGWLGSAYVFLLSTGVLQGIPGDLYEAADIDGATSWQKVRHITLPLILFQTAPLLVGQYTFNFNNFSIIYLFNGGGPFNPSQYGNLAGSSDLLISYIFKLTMENQYQAIGAAITSLISIGLMFFAYLGFRNSKAFKEERL